MTIRRNLFFLSAPGSSKRQTYVALHLFFLRLFTYLLILLWSTVIHDTTLFCLITNFSVNPRRNLTGIPF